MLLETRIVALAQAVGADIKSLKADVGSVSSLATTNKTNVVAAINELLTLIVTINDLAGDGATTVTWSANKIFDAIEAAKAAVKNELTAGAGSALDTLSELAAALGNDPSFAANIASAIAARVRYDAAQTLTTGQKLQACENIGIGNPDRDFVYEYGVAKA